jgi:hypothetical protein
MGGVKAAHGEPLPIPDLSDEQLAKLADLVASGGTPFPDEVSPAVSARLTVEVRRRLRHRLLALVARAVANDIIRETHGESKA